MGRRVFFRRRSSGSRRSVAQMRIVPCKVCTKWVTAGLEHFFGRTAQRLKGCRNRHLLVWHRVPACRVHSGAA
jgi:hypothetical protein